MTCASPHSSRAIPAPGGALFATGPFAICWCRALVLRRIRPEVSRSARRIGRPLRAMMLTMAVRWRGGRARLPSMAWLRQRATVPTGERPRPCIGRCAMAIMLSVTTLESMPTFGAH